ncbi:MAG: UDP-N-acetylenolpyruvoylglucosamine reductase, partial [Chlamydiae bacterium]|nr:UDP-N-acetylenolpyruvoylglucosamine reductase [Chlamydiota bacterium]
EIVFDYRTSSFQKMSGAILSATFQLEVDPSARQRQLEIIEKRIQTQPLKEKSAGCVFRNPEPYLSAGRLIDECGLKGMNVGGAAISEMHANFFINQKNASSKDVRTLIERVQAKILEEKGIHLEIEIRMIGPHG